MRVVACNASQASIAPLSPATALFQAVGLCAQVREPGQRRQLDVPLRAMTGAAKIYGICRRKFAGIKNKVRLARVFP